MGIVSWILRWLTLARVPNRVYPLLDTGNRLSQLGIPLIVWLLATCAFAQNSRFESVALGPKGPIPFALVAVCTQPANTSSQPCSPPANLCSSLSDTICTSPNPLTSDALGHYHFYIKQAQSPFTVQIYGPQVESPLVLPDQSAGVSTGSITKFTEPRCILPEPVISPIYPQTSTGLLHLRSAQLVCRTSSMQSLGGGDSRWGNGGFQRRRSGGLCRKQSRQPARGTFGP